MSVTITVPMIPPSVNSYVRHSRGRHFKTPEANRFLETLVACARGAGAVSGKGYGVAIIIWLGKGDRGDIDNFPKLVLDGLVLAGVIDTDSKVVVLLIRKHRDADNPRTEIIVSETEL